MDKIEKGLYIVATPIGNLDDLSLRAEKILSMVDFIICENPLHSLKLLNSLGIKKKLFSLHDYNEGILIKRIEKYQQNSSIALISDAGSPLISDPGYNLVIDYINKNLMVTTVPGPSSIIAALQLSGLPIHNFKFFGFVSKNQSVAETLVNNIKELDTTAVLFISGVRLLNFLETLLKKEMTQSISVCKELTKKNEKVFRGKAKQIIEEILIDKKTIKGEFIIVIEGIGKKSQKNLNPETKKQMIKLLKKFSLTEVVEMVHKISGISKKDIYKTALLIKND